VWKAQDIFGIKPPELGVICLPKFWQRKIKQLRQRKPAAQMKLVSLTG